MLTQLVHNNGTNIFKYGYIHTLHKIETILIVYYNDDDYYLEYLEVC